MSVMQDSKGFFPWQVMLNTGMVALLIPRSLFTRDSMFFIDIFWNAVLGWGQLAVLFSLRHSLSGSALSLCHDAPHQSSLFAVCWAKSDSNSAFMCPPRRPVAPCTVCIPAGHTVSSDAPLALQHIPVCCPRLISGSLQVYRRRDSGHYHHM